MKIIYFTHSLLSDWNHGNAHFLRGVIAELVARGHDVHVYEPRDAWSVKNLVAEYGEKHLDAYNIVYPTLTSIRYDLNSLNLNDALGGADLVIVHEWSDHDLVRRIGRLRAEHSGFRLLFHDTHHRSITDRGAMASYDLRHYDGVLAFGNVIKDIYLAEGWTRRAWTWHEAADTRVFHPLKAAACEGDLVWIGNWGDGERSAELQEFLLEPVKALGLKAKVYGVRYPDHARTALAEAGISYGGWLPNYEAPQAFSRYKVTVHVPRRPYVRSLPGIPTIRVFEALACGIPLISAPWTDNEGLFTPGADFWIAKDGADMTRKLEALLTSPAIAADLAQHGLETIHKRHTCVHRVDELMSIYRELRHDERKVQASA